MFWALFCPFTSVDTCGSLLKCLLLLSFILYPTELFFFFLELLWKNIEPYRLIHWFYLIYFIFLPQPHPILYHCLLSCFLGNQLDFIFYIQIYVCVHIFVFIYIYLLYVYICTLLYVYLYVHII